MTRAPKLVRELLRAVKRDDLSSDTRHLLLCAADEIVGLERKLGRTYDPQWFLDEVGSSAPNVAVQS